MRGIRDGMNVGLKRQWGQRQVSYALPNGVEPIVVMDFKNGVYTWDGATIDPADALEGFDPAFVSADGMLVGDTYLPRSTAALTALMGDPHAIVLDTVTTGIPNFEVLFSYVSHEGGSTHCQAYKAGDPQSLIIYQPAVDAFSGGEWPEALSRVALSLSQDAFSGSVNGSVPVSFAPEPFTLNNFALYSPTAGISYTVAGFYVYPFIESGSLADYSVLP
jgi:hypothetical protein